MSLTVANADWAADIASEAAATSCLTIGLVHGSREPSNRLAVDQLVANVAAQFEQSCKDRMLLLRLAVHASSELERADDQAAAIPVAKRSPLGAWSEVTVPVPVGKQASWSLQQLPIWLPSWKDAFRLILVDLGPVHLVPSRMVGRLCDGSYLLLGPEACGSTEWLLQQIAWHAQSGSTVCGTLVTNVARAA